LSFTDTLEVSFFFFFKILNEVSLFETAMISGFRRDADEICALIGYNAASGGNPLPTFRDNVSVPSSSLKKSKKTDTLSRNVGARLSFDAV
jgi:hypothetical protein